MVEIAAGGVVYRRREGALEIQMIEDRFGRMTLAKGHMEAGETLEETALREIAEETGIRGNIVDKIAVIKYAYESAERGKSDKEVHYYLVEALGGDLHAQVEEITGVAWYSPAEAMRLQRSAGYANNTDVLGAALKRLGIETEDGR